MITAEQRQLRQRLARLPLTRGTLAAHVQVMPTGCWHWLLAPMTGGYGRKQQGGVTKKAHRAVWELFRGPISGPKLEVCHTCDNPICVNPDHLFLGTALDNNRDCIAKDRHYRGERVKQAKLTAVAVVEIRSLYRWRDPLYGIPALAKRFGVSVGVVGKVINRQLWRHVK